VWSFIRWTTFRCAKHDASWIAILQRARISSIITIDCQMKMKNTSFLIFKDVSVLRFSHPVYILLKIAPVVAENKCCSIFASVVSCELEVLRNLISNVSY
jgi:hypothetical protein